MTRTLLMYIRKEWKIIRHDAGILMFCILVPLFYPLLYTYIYNTELMREVPVCVVDKDNSSLSRQFARHMDATQWVSVVSRSANEEDALNRLRRQDAFGYIVIPEDFSSSLARGEQAYVGVYGEMSGLLYYKALRLAATDVSLELNRQIKIQLASLPTAQEESVAAYPATNQEIALFNPQQGFASFLIPAVLILILQQTLLLGIGLANGTTAERRPLRAVSMGEIVRLLRRPRQALRPAGGGQTYLYQLVARPAVYLALYALLAAYGTCVVPTIFNLPLLSHMGDLLLFLLPFLLSAIYLAMTLSILLRNREMCIMVYVVTSVPLLFLSGISWPTSAIPSFWQGVAALFPSTHAVMGFTRINTMGATLAQVMPEWRALWILTAVYLLTTIIVVRRQN